MKVKINNNHRAAIERKQRSVDYWRQHPMSLQECLLQFKRLREQRFARESKSTPSTSLP